MKLEKYNKDVPETGCCGGRPRACGFLLGSEPKRVR